MLRTLAENSRPTARELARAFRGLGVNATEPWLSASPGAHRGGKLRKEPARFFPLDAGVGDALAVNQRLIKGSGTCSGKASGDGSSFDWDCTGTYSMGMAKMDKMK